MCCEPLGVLLRGLSVLPHSESQGSGVLRAIAPPPQGRDVGRLLTGIYPCVFRSVAAGIDSASVRAPLNLDAARRTMCAPKS